MTKCILTGKTYPDHKPQQHRSVNAARKNMEYGLGQLDWLNAEHLSMARKLYEAIQHLNQNRGDEFSHTLMEVAGLSDHFICHRNSLAYEYIRDKIAVKNRTEKALISQTDYVSLYSDLAGYLVNEAQANGGLDEVFVEADNGDEHYTEEAQDMFNQYSDDVCEILDNYFETDDVCRNGKPIADCECC